MTVVDANVLSYAVNSAAERHDEASAWLDGELNAGRPVGFAWLVVLAFVRLSTAALAIEPGATVVTYDSDFGRFEGVAWSPPRADGRSGPPMR